MTRHRVITAWAVTGHYSLLQPAKMLSFDNPQLGRRPSRTKLEIVSI